MRPKQTEQRRGCFACRVCVLLDLCYSQIPSTWRQGRAWTAESLQSSTLDTFLEPILKVCIKKKKICIWMKLNSNNGSKFTAVLFDGLNWHIIILLCSQKPKVLHYLFSPFRLVCPHSLCMATRTVACVSVVLLYKWCSFAWPKCHFPPHSPADCWDRKWRQPWW